MPQLFINDYIITTKTYTYMATMEKGNYNGQDTYESGSMEISGYRIKDCY